MTENMSALSRFAHLAGFGKPDKQNAAKTQAELDAEALASGKKAEDDEAADKKSKKGEGKEGDEDEDEDDDDEDKDEEAKKALATAVAAATKAERERCAAIFSVQDAQGRVALAASLAFETDLSAEAAVAILKTSPKGQGATGDRYDQLMSTVTNPQVGSEAGTEGPQGETQKLIARATAAYDTASGAKK